MRTETAVHDLGSGLAAAEPRRLLMDLSELGFLGLPGTAVFERIRRRAGRSEVGLSLVGLPAAGARALAHTGVVGRYDQYSDLAAALGATRPDTR